MMAVSWLGCDDGIHTLRRQEMDGLLLDCICSAAAPLEPLTGQGYFCLAAERRL